MHLQVTSETGTLNGVIVHTPGHEVSLVNPALKDELLFDDIIFEEDARQEHLDMLKVFEAAMPTDGAIFQITDLLAECLQQEEARQHLTDALIKALPEDNLHLIADTLLTLSARQLQQFLVEGRTPGIANFALPPSPNLLFTRDLAAVAGEHIILSKAAKKARLRESLIMQTLVRHHPLFEPFAERVISSATEGSIEGGDVLVASENTILIGMSERTSFSAVMDVAQQLLAHNFEYVLAVDIPKQRSSMHLDTIFTFASPTECVVFPPAIMQGTSNTTILTLNGEHIQAEPAPSLQQALNDVLETDIQFLKCGGENRTNQYREQWTDGANVFALAPGVVVGYERNTKTFAMLRSHGYKVISQYEFIEEFKDKPFTPDGQKWAISFLGHELCRGRGGARCMTMPLSRT